MTEDPPLLIWQRAALARGERIDVTPQQRAEQASAAADRGPYDQRAAVRSNAYTTAGQPEQIPEPRPATTGGRPARSRRAKQPALRPVPGPIPGREHTWCVVLPRWDIAWEQRTTGRGKSKRLKINKKGKPVMWRRVWDPLRGNARNGSWHARHEATRDVIQAVILAARHAGLPRRGSHVTVRLTWAPGDRRRADVDNLVHLQKACCDALARGRDDLPGLHLVPDDTAQWMTKDMPRIAPPPAEGLWLTVEVRPWPGAP